MPVLTFAPSAVGTYDGWTLGAGASKVAAVATNDGDTSYITATNGVAETQQSFTITFTGASIINSVRVGAVTKSASEANVWALGIGYNGVFTGGEWIVVNPSLSYTTFLGTTYTTNPYTGAPWDVNNMNLFQIWCYMDEFGSADTMRITQLYAEIDYIPAAGNTNFLIG